MSKSTVERKIVQMVFEAKKFQQGIRNSLESLSDFKKAFQLESAQKSLTDLEKAADVDFSPMSRALDSINNKLSITGVAAAAVVTKITESVMAGAQKLAGALIFDPITGGLQEYETQLNAVQTILANTAKAGTTLEDVTSALGELNDYADLTIYNFTQMVDSIGKFTTAGVDLATSVQAIKGIANIAAISGASAQQASTAMYQMSQAISSGVVRLQDWMSIENAGMGGTIFQDSLLETARLHGVAVDAMVAKNGSFRYSLAEGWLSSEIMLETLDKFTGDLTDAQLLALGYTQEQIEGIQQTAQLALDAATKIKTLTALKDTLAEVLGSGWAQTWEIIFGNFEDAKELWGGLADVFTPLIEASTKVRNDLLRTWSAMGGRTEAIAATHNILEALINLFGVFGEAIGEVFGGFSGFDLYYLTRAFRDWTEGLREGSEGLDTFKIIIKAVASIFSILWMVVKAVLKPFASLLGLATGVGGGLLDIVAVAAKAIIAFRNMAEETGFFDTVVASIIAGIGKFIEQVKELVARFRDLEVVKAVAQWFQELERADFVRLWESFLKVITAIVTPFVALAFVIAAAYGELLKLKAVQDIVAWFQNLSLDATVAWFRELQTSIGDLIDEVKGSDLVTKFLEVIQTFDGRRAKQFFGDAKEGFSWMGSLTDVIKGGLDAIAPQIQVVRDGLSSIAGGIKDGLLAIFNYIIDNAGNLDYDRLFQIINAGLFGGLILSLRKMADMFSLDTIFGDSDFGEAIVEDLEELGGVLSGLSINLKADALKSVAVAIALLAGSIFLLTLVDSTKLGDATASIALMTVALFGATGALATINIKGATSAAIAIIGVSVAIGIAAIALKQVADIDPARLEGSLDAMGKGLAALVISTVSLSKGSNTASLLKTVAIMYGLSKALKALSGAIQAFGNMDPEVLSRGILGVSAALGMLTASVIAMSRLGGEKSAKAGAGMLIISGALLALGLAVEKFGKMEVAPLEQGLESIGLILLGFAGFSLLLQKKDFIQAGISIAIIAGALIILEKAIGLFAAYSWEEMKAGLNGIALVLVEVVLAANLMGGAMTGALATGVMALALIGLATAFTMMSELTWDEITMGLKGMALALGIIGVAGYLLGPAVPVLIGLGIAMALIGLGALMFGAGLFVAALGLVAIAGAAIPIAAAIKIVGGAIIETLPGLATAFGEALVNFLTIIAEKTPEIIEAFKKIIIAMLDALTDPEFLPHIVGSILGLVTALLEEIGKRLPDLIQAGYDILIALLEGIGDNIADVVAAGLNIITEFMAGIADGFPKLLLQAGETILVILEGVETAIDTYMADIIATGIRIAVAIVEGIVKGVGEGIIDVKDALLELAQDAWDAVVDFFEFWSPSKRAYRAAQMIVAGLVIGIETSAYKLDNAFGTIKDAYNNAIDPLMDSVVGDLGLSSEFNPVISPVLDLDNVRRGAKELQGLGYASSILAAVDYEQGGGYTTSIPLGGPGAQPKNQGVTFIQQNYSPKALDRETIYRQTRTQVARLQEERAFG